MKLKNTLKKFLALALLTGCITTYAAESNSSTFPDWLQELSQEASDKEIQELFFNSFITDSTKAIRYNIKALKAFNTSMKLIKDVKKMPSLIAKYEKKAPLFLLTECDSSKCVMSRICTPEYREEFEFQAARNVYLALERNSSVQKTTQYVGFGSGEMLLDCCIVSKALMLQKLQGKTTLTLDVHLIDPLYSQYKEIRESLHANLEITKNEKVTEKLYPYFVTMPAEQFEKAFNITFWRENRLDQFLSFFKTHFPEANLSLFIHNSTDEYLDFIKKYNFPFPDSIVAADIQSDSTTEEFTTEPLEGYQKLCTFALDKNPAVTTLLLSKELEKGKKICRILPNGQMPSSSTLH